MFRGPAAAGNMRDTAGNAQSDLRHAFVIERVGRIGVHVVVRIAKVAGVGEHEGLIALIPERAVIGAADVVDDFGQTDGE